MTSIWLPSLSMSNDETTSHKRFILNHETYINILSTVVTWRLRISQCEVFPDTGHALADYAEWSNLYCSSKRTVKSTNFWDSTWARFSFKAWGFICLTLGVWRVVVKGSCQGSQANGDAGINVCLKHRAVLECQLEILWFWNYEFLMGKPSN